MLEAGGGPTGESKVPAEGRGAIDTDGDDLHSLFEMRFEQCLFGPLANTWWSIQDLVDFGGNLRFRIHAVQMKRAAVIRTAPHGDEATVVADIDGKHSPW